MYVYVNASMFKTNSLWYILKENPIQRLSINVLVQLSSMKNISKQCFLCNKLVENYTIHIMLSCFHLLEDREHLIENILNKLDVDEFVDFENQTIENSI